MFGTGMSSPLVSEVLRLHVIPKTTNAQGTWTSSSGRGRQISPSSFPTFLSAPPTLPVPRKGGSTGLMPETRKNQRGEISGIYSSVLVSHTMISSSKSDIVVYLQTWGVTNSCKSNPKCVLFLHNTSLCILMEYGTALCEIQMNGLLLACQKSGLEVVPHNALWLECEVRPAVFPSISIIYEWFDPYKNYAIFH